MEDCGGMAERLKAAVLKTAEARASVGSNPTPSARLGGDTPPTLGGDTPQRITRNRNVPLGSVPLWTPWECPRRTGEVAESAEGNRLLSGCTGKTVPRVRIPPSPPRFSTTGDPGIRTGDAADEQEEKRDFRSASGGVEAGRAMARSPKPHRANPSLSATIFADRRSGNPQRQVRNAERCPSWPKERDWKSRRWLNPASRVRIPPSPPRFSTTGDPGIRTGDAADEQEEKRDFRSASGGDEAGRAMARSPKPHRANPSLSAIAMVAFNLRPGEGTERKEEENGEMKRFCLVFVAFLVFAHAGTSCKKKEQPPVMPPKQEGAPGQAAAPHGMGGGQEKKVVVPEGVKAVWTAVKIISASNDLSNPACNIEVLVGGNQAFKGWLFARYPDIHPFEHGKYGVKLLEGVRK